MVVFDANFLIHFLDPRLGGSGGLNPRIDYLVKQIEDRKDIILIPTPALAELLVKTGQNSPKYLDTIERSRFFKVAPFDQRAAVECSVRIADALKRRKEDAAQESRDKVKFDQQILAVAVVNRATAIYTNDTGLANQAREAGMEAFGIGELPAPPADAQLNLELEPEEPIEPEDDED